jgi:hypothetical protein
MSTRTPSKLSRVERAELERVSRRPSTPQALAKRCRVILLDDREDMTYAEIGEELSIREQTVLKWRSRFLKHRMAGLRDAPRPGVKKITKALARPPSRVPPALHAPHRQLAQPGQACFRGPDREATPPRRISKGTAASVARLCTARAVFAVMGDLAGVVGRLNGANTRLDSSVEATFGTISRAVAPGLPAPPPRSGSIGVL